MTLLIYSRCDLHCSNLISRSFILPMPERRPTEIHDFQNLQNASGSIKQQFLTFPTIPRCFLNDSNIILLNLIFHHSHNFEKVCPSSWCSRCRIIVVVVLVAVVIIVVVSLWCWSSVLWQVLVVVVLVAAVIIVFVVRIVVVALIFVVADAHVVASLW